MCHHDWNIVSLRKHTHTHTQTHIDYNNIKHTKHTDTAHYSCKYFAVCCTQCDTHATLLTLIHAGLCFSDTVPGKSIQSLQCEIIQEITYTELIIIKHYFIIYHTIPVTFQGLFSPSHTPSFLLNMTIK